MSFKTSVNIKFDIGNQDFIDRYIPTPSHSEVLEGLLDSLSNGGNSANMIIGPYGTGKSLLGTILANISAKEIKNKEFKKLVDKFNYFDENIAEKLIKLNKRRRVSVPVILSGNEGRFRDAVIAAVMNALDRKKIAVTLPGTGMEIMNVVDHWKEMFPDTYSTFVQYINQDYGDLDQWLKEIQKHNQGEIDYFKFIYPKLTSGARLSLGRRYDFLTQLEEISKQLHEQNLGVFLVYDEFGRYLSSLTPDSYNEAMQDLQDIAEFVERISNFNMLLISHKGISQYFDFDSKEIIQEFNRVEKRYKKYYVSNDQLTFIKIAELILNENMNNRPYPTENQLKYEKEFIHSFNLFPTLDPEIKGINLVEKLYPLHPVTTFLLPKLSSLFGQNERTLFTFLESDSSNGLRYHINRKETFYYAQHLFDFFFSEIEDLDVDDNLKSEILEYRKAVARLTDDTNTQVSHDILKLITLWSVLGLNSSEQMSLNMIVYSLGYERLIIEETLSLLEQKKIIRFNVINNYYEIHKGSSINIHERAAEKIDEFEISEELLISKLHKNLKRNYYFPDIYNDKYGMTRFATIRLITANSLYDLNNKYLENEDLTILYVLPDDRLSFKDAENLIIESVDGKDKITSIHPRNINEILMEIKRNVIFENLLEDGNFISEDKGVQEELRLLIEESNYKIANYLSPLFRFDKSLKWLHEGKEIDVLDQRDLSMKLSTICEQLYPDTPVILNDSFNRRRISGNQKKAAIQLINNIINYPKEPQFNITGSGPDYAIFAAVFKQRDYLDYNVNQFNFDDIEYKPYRKLRSALIKHLKNHPKGNFSSLINIFKSTPYGIRNPIIPVLLVALLRDRWTEFMLYRNNMFVSNITGEVLFEILEEEGPQNYDYVYENLDDSHIDFFNHIENGLRPHIPETLDGRSRIIISCSTLLNWLRSLPRYTQITQYADDQFIIFRDYIRKAEVNPQQSIELLNEKFWKVNKFDSMIQYGNEHIQHAETIIKREVIEFFNKYSIHSLDNWANDRHEFLKKNNKLISSIQNLGDNFTTLALVDQYIGVPISDWSDGTKELLFNQLKQDIENAIAFENDKPGEETDQFISIDINGQKKVVSKVELSTKSNTIYRNIDRMLKNAGRNVTQDEIEYIVLKVFQEYVE